MMRQRVRQYLPLYLVMGLDHDHISAVDLAHAALKGGITALQLREKDAPLSRILQEGREIRELCRKYHVPFFVNDRVDVALLLHADGVHVGQDDIPGSEVRKLVGSQTVIGISASSMDEAKLAMAEGADYLGVGSIFATATKKDAGNPIGTELIRELKQTFGVPMVGIGGIGLGNYAGVIEAGADGIAVVSAITAQAEPEAAAQALRLAVQAKLS